MSMHLCRIGVFFSVLGRGCAMRRLKCPQCATVVDVAEGQMPVCSSCGFGAAATTVPQSVPQTVPRATGPPVGDPYAAYADPTMMHGQAAAPPAAAYAPSTAQVAGAGHGRPGAVTAVAVYDFIACGLAFLFGLLLLLAGGVIAQLFDEAGGAPLAGLAAGMLALVGFVLLGLGVLVLFIGLGLLKGQKWAWVVQIVFAALGLLSGMTSLAMGDIFSALWSFLVDGLVLWAMLVPASIAWFNRGAPAYRAGVPASA